MITLNAVELIGGLGTTELLVILAIVILIFGGSRLPQIGEGIGKAIRSFKRGVNTDDDIDVSAPEKDAKARLKSKATETIDEAEGEIVEEKNG